jgi:hypothetical protein
MTLDSLEKLEDDDLRRVAARCGELLAQRDRQRKEKRFRMRARSWRRWA